MSSPRFEAGALAARLPGLDFDLLNASFADFSDLEVAHLVSAAGLTYRFSDRLRATASVEVYDYRDARPYLFDTTGRRVFTYAGVSWTF